MQGSPDLERETTILEDPTLDQETTELRNLELERETTMLPEFSTSDSRRSSVSVASTTSSSYFGSRPGSSSSQTPMSVFRGLRRSNTSTSSLGLR